LASPPSFFTSSHCDGAGSCFPPLPPHNAIETLCYELHARSLTPQCALLWSSRVFFFTPSASPPFGPLCTASIPRGPPPDKIGVLPFKAGLAAGSNLLPYPLVFAIIFPFFLNPFVVTFSFASVGSTYAPGLCRVMVIRQKCADRIRSPPLSAFFLM